jgi:uncharacterized membrane protein
MTTVVVMAESSQGPAKGTGTAPAGSGPRQTGDDRVAWGIASKSEHRWPASLAVIVAIVLQIVLPETVLRGLGPRWFIPALEGFLLVALIVTNPGEINRESRLLRAMSLTLIGIITVANIVALGELVSALLNHTPAGGRSLVFASVPIWLTNVIVFGLWYWELDRGGVAARLRENHRRPDFLFPHMSTPGSGPNWTPDFLDFLFTSFANATAFSPTDTMPLTAWSKLLMMMQSTASLLTVALVVSRAVNILN